MSTFCGKERGRGKLRRIVAVPGTFHFIALN